ncbi:MAG TPA: TonB-dependent receptor [Chitinophagaceae bacterium]|nr:TonB-dependent receptor [Chitinophagaceae bacterium]
MTKILKSTLAVVLLLVSCLTGHELMAQNRQVKGKISDDAGLPLQGANVQLKGTRTLTQTNMNGEFSIQVPASGTVELIITNAGFNPITVTAGAEDVVVRLERNISALEDVVVVGYATVRKKDLTGATSSMSGRDVEKIPVTSIAEAMTGRLAGVQVTTTDGAPGAEIVIRVRGGGSVTQDNSPLYIVDGFPVSSINEIATTDIATIDILKDASSTAIYGARGANGVVIITTKSAKGGKTTISFNSYLQGRTLPKKLKVLSPYEFVLAQYEYARVRSQTDLDNFTKYFGVYDDLELYKAQKGTDWQEKLFGDIAYSQQHNLSLTGGTDKTKFSFSITNNNDNGILVGSGYNRTYMNFKLNHEIAKALKFDLTSRFTNTEIDGAGTSGGSSLRTSDGITTRPVNGIADQIVIDPISAGPDDEYEQFLKNLINPIALAAQDYRKRVDKTFNSNVAVSWSVIKSLVLRSEFGLDLSFGTNKRYYGPLTGESRNVGGNLPLGEITNYNNLRYRWANTASYKMKLANIHDFNFVVGQEIIAGNVKSNFNRSKYFDANLQPDRLFANMALGTPDRYETFEGPGDNLMSFFGQAFYQLKNRYLVTLTGRADASNKFAPGKRWGIFPAMAIAWRISEEEFMQNISFISDLKWRVSYGEAGNNRIQNDLWRRTYRINTNRPIGFGDVPQAYWGAASNILVNPDLQWETTITRNTGLDFGLWANRINGTLEFYWNTTKDLLVESDIPSYLGYSKQMRNIGQTSNRGVELSLNVNIVNKKDFQLSGFFNIGVNRSKIDKLDGVNEKPFSSNWAGTDLKTQDDYRAIVGQTVGLIYGYVTDGYYGVDDFESYNPATRVYTLKPGIVNVGSFMGGLSLRPGLLKLKDLDGDGVISAADRQIIGSALPKHSGGFGFNAAYKGFDLATFFNWVVGNDVYNTGKIAFNMFYRTTYGNMLNTMNYNDRFKYIDAAGNQVTDLVELGKLNANARIWSPFSMGNAAPVIHSWAIEDGSFLRLNNITLGYSLPKSLISKVRMTKFRIYATVYNAFLWTKYTGYDPEVSATRSSSYTALTPGVDYSGYPKARTYTLGVNVNF